MARFEVYRFASRSAPLVVDVQAELLASLSTRVVVPLAPKSSDQKEALPRLKPILRIAGKDYVFKPTDIAVLPAGLLRDPVANIEAEYRREIIDALDFLFQGFWPFR